MRRLWCTAQIWGTGPIAKLASILATGVLPQDCTYINADPNYYEYFLAPLNIRWQKAALTEVWKYLAAGDVLLAVMHPEYAIIAKTLGVKVVYVDSLTWFWPVWNEVDTGYYARFLKLREYAPSAWDTMLGIVRFANLYDLQWAAHLLADRSCVQDVFPLGREVLDILDLRGGYTPVGAIVDPRFSRTAPPVPKTVLINLGACYSNPHYVDWAIQVFSRVAEGFPAYSFSMHTPAIAGQPPILPKNFRVSSISRGEFIAALGSATLAFSPPGLTFFLEATSLGHQVFLLPPQHCGQIKNEAKLCAQFPALPHLGWDDVGPGASVRKQTASALAPVCLDDAAQRIISQWDHLHPRTGCRPLSHLCLPQGVAGAEQTAEVVSSLTVEQ